VVHIVSYEQVHEWMALANLAILIGVLLLVAFSIYLERKRKVVWHGNTMLVVVFITGLLVIAHMGPSLISVIDESTRGFDVVALSGLVHSVVGIAAFIPGVWLVGVWAYIRSSDTRYCIKRKKLMWKILVLWLLALGLGTVYYLLHITFG
jgi:hypothetical protein